MKIVVIADIHGRDLWKKQVEEEADLYIFLGDYFDSFNIPHEIQISNFLDIKKFYEDNKDKVVLLAGNHCLSYITSSCACSGFNYTFYHTINHILKPMYLNGDLKACKVINNYLFVHAGVSKTWCDLYDIDLDNLEESINDLFKREIFAFCFQHSYFNTIRGMNYKYRSDSYGENFWQSPFWIRPNSLLESKIDNYIQVVGHTAHEKHTFKEGVWFTDTQEFINEPLILEI